MGVPLRTGDSSAGRAYVQRMRPGPFTRWPRTADAVLAAVLFVLTLLFTTGPDDSWVRRDLGDVPLWVVLLFAVGSGALYWRRHAPVVVLAVVLAAWALTLGSGHADLGGHALVALYALGRYGSVERWGHVGVDVALVVLVLDGVTGDVPWSGVAFGVVIFFAVWYVGRRVRLRSERAVLQERELRERERRIVAEERSRIARELHDVVAHRVSLMTVQAGAARTVAADDPAAAARAMGAVEEAGRQALDELRYLLGVLRPSAVADDTAPQPGLVDLPALVARMREAGLDVDLDVDPRLAADGELPARVQLSAYRIVQECLTNVVKHAGPGARTGIRLRAEGRELVIEVSDDGSGGTSLPGAGHGIVGMRERAQLLGGSLDVGPRPDGGFAARARLPLDDGAA